MKLTKGVQKWLQSADIVEVQAAVRVVPIARRVNMNITMMRNTVSGAVRRVTVRVALTVPRANIATGLDRTSAFGVAPPQMVRAALIARLENMRSEAWAKKKQNPPAKVGFIFWESEPH